MLLTLSRFKFTPESTLGQWYVDGEKLFYSNKYDKMMPIYSLEDTDRDLYDYMTVKEIMSVKVKGRTAIPYGRYKVVLRFSNRFQRIMPHIEDVKGFDGILFHNGSFVKDTEGCPLVGYEWHYLPKEDQYMVNKSRDCFAELFSVLTFKASKGEEIFIEIVK